MPRISPSTIRRAYNISPHAATLLPATRDLPSTLNELRWIREHVRQSPTSSIPQESQVTSLCRRRGRGVPLQYVLGTQPFGNLEIKCRPGVLIPRPEPEAYTTHLASLIKTTHLLSGSGGDPSSPPTTLRVLDLCTGTGCIALLLYSLLRRAVPDLHARGIDICPQAVQLARENARHNASRGLLGPSPSPSSPSPPSSSPSQVQPPPRKSLAFSQADIFSDALLEDLAAPPWQQQQQHRHRRRPWDVMVCNPPYVSHWGFAHQTARCVRNHEPKLAQVPMVTYDSGSSGGGGSGTAAAAYEPEDVFYARLLDIGARLRPGVMLFEVGDLDQALRVVDMALGHKGLSGAGAGIRAEVWRDWPDATPEEGEETLATVCGGSRQVQVRGSGHGRSVFIQCS